MADPSEKVRRIAIRPPPGSHRRVEPAPKVTGPAYLFPYACMTCRKSFKRKAIEDKTGLPDKKCPDCGGLAIGLYRHFKAPPKDDIQQWKKVEFLIQNGFRFNHQLDGNGCVVPYPTTMAEAKNFVLQYAKPKQAKR